MHLDADLAPETKTTTALSTIKTHQVSKEPVALSPAHTLKSDYPPVSGYTPLIGRKNQINLLDQQHLEVEKQSFCIALLSGEPGSGKTELIKQYFNRQRVPNTLLIDLHIDRENYQTDQFIQALITHILDQLSHRKGKTAEQLLASIVRLLHNEKLEWIVERPNDHENKESWPRKIIRRDAFIAHLKRVLIECCQLIAGQRHITLCFIKNIELLEFNCLDFIADTFRTQTLPAMHLIANTPQSRFNSVDFFLRDLKDYSTKIREPHLFLNIQLPALSLHEIQQVIEKHLGSTTFNTANLTQYIFDNSKGNPGRTVFILELLKELKLLYFSYESGSWFAQLERIKRDKVLEKHRHQTNQMVERSYCSKKIMIYAACYHLPFSQDILQAITPNGLWPQINNTIKLGLKYGILDYDPESANHYTFRSENVVRTTLKLENTNSRNLIYRKIFNTLVAHYPNKPPFQKWIPLYQIADCINQVSLNAIRYNPKAVYQKVALNLLAGYRAYVRNTITQAYRYLNNAVELIDPRFFNEYHSISYFTIFHWLRCLYLREAYDKCIEKCIEFENFPLTEIEKAKLVIIKIYCFKATANHKQAIKAATRTLHTFGIKTPRKVNISHCLIQLIQSSYYFHSNPWVSGKLKIQPDLTPSQWTKKRKPLEKERVKLIHKLVEMIAQSGYFEDIHYAYYFSLKLIPLSHSLGITSHSSLGIQYYTFLQFVTLNKTKLLQHNYTHQTHIDSSSSNNQIINEMFYWGMYAPWRKPLRQVIKNLLRTYETYHHTSDDESAGHCISLCLSYSLIQGYDFKRIVENFSAVAPELEAPKYSSAHFCNLMMAQAMQNITEPSSQIEDHTHLRGKWFDENIHKDSIHHDNFISRFCYHMIRCYLHLMFNDHAQCVQHYQSAQPILKKIYGLYTIAALRFIGEMGLLATLHTRHNPFKTMTQIPRLLYSIFYFKRAARQQPDNFSSFYYLLKGFAISALLPNKKSAIKNINKGIQLAIAGRYLNFAAIASELKYTLIYKSCKPHYIAPLKKSIRLYQRNHNIVKQEELMHIIREFEK